MKIDKIQYIFTSYPFQHALTILWQYVFRNIKLCLDTFFAKLNLWLWGGQVGPKLNVAGRIRCNNRGQLILGKRVSINSGPDRNFVGGDRRVSFWVGNNAKLILENDVRISGTTIVAMVSVIIREGTFIGGGCDIYDTDFHQLEPEERRLRCGGVGQKPVEIGPWAFIGGHTIILKGVRIGEGAVIGAGSLVANNIPPFEVWAGRPACFIRKLNDSAVEGDAA